MKAKSKYAQAAANIKHELSEKFPGIKFSTRSKSFSMGNSVDVSWELGPTSRGVQPILDKYTEGHFDGMTDYYEYGRDPQMREFQAKYGSAKYVSGQRLLPEGLFERVCRDIAAHFGITYSSQWQRRENDSLSLGDYAHRALEHTSFPAGAEYVGVASGWELSLTGACASDEAIRIIHTMTDEEAEIRAAVKREFNRIKAREEQERPRLALLCGQSTMDADDVIAPCVLRAGHAGYCETGRAA